MDNLSLACQSLLGSGVVSRFLAERIFCRGRRTRELTIRLEWLQPDLLRNSLLDRVGGLQSSQIKNQVPCLVRLQIIGKGGHGRSIQSGHEILVHGRVGCPALEAVLIVEIERLDRPVLIVGKSVGRRSVAAAGYAMTLPAFHLLKENAALLDSLGCYRWFRWYDDGSAGLLRQPSRREMLHVSDQVHAVLVRERPPGWHIGVEHATSDGVVQIGVGRERSGRGGATAKDSDREVARLGIDPLRVLAFPVAKNSVASNTEPLVDWRANGSISRHVADVALHAESLIFAVLRLLCPTSDRERQNCKDTQGQPIFANSYA